MTLTYKQIITSLKNTSNLNDRLNIVNTNKALIGTFTNEEQNEINYLAMGQKCKSNIAG